ncbi:hypothetical protein HJFPF1_08147 [Paramyrothecium foliicola]|nr:hypothetical protein HJFPF1_08147 [Paramyrothecium foliicola]
MDPYRRPSRSRDHLDSSSAAPGPSSWGRRARDYSPSRSPRNLTPSPSATSRMPVTPDAVPETASDYFNPATFAQSSSRGQSHPLTATASTTSTPQRPERDRQPSIRIRRSAASSLRSRAGSTGEPFPAFDGDYSSNHHQDVFQAGRPRAVSQPERTSIAVPEPTLARHSRRAPQIAMPRLTEEGSRPTMAELGLPGSPMSPSRSLPGSINYPPTETHDYAEARKKMQKRSMVSRMLWPTQFRRNQSQAQFDHDAAAAGPAPLVNPNGRSQDEYDEELVDWLDIIDPEVQTLSTLTNVQNSLFIPDLGHWVNRRPTYVLSEHAADQLPRRRESDAQQRLQREETVQPSQPTDTDEIAPVLQRSSTITSRLTESHYAALPHGTSLEGWTAEEKWQLDDHVRHMLHSRRSKFKRSLKGFGQYVRRPLGFFVTLYATLITLFGLAWVLFLIGWIYVGEKQVYVIHIIDSVLVALFAIMGDGLAPFRAIDTYHMWYVARYSRMIKRAKAGIPPRARLQKRMPSEVREMLNASAQTDRMHMAGPNSRETSDSNGQILTNGEQIDDQNLDLEDGKLTDLELATTYLTPKQAKSFAHHQKKLAKSHSFYKPKETFTHHAFPLKYLIAIVILLDCHSCLQISLGATTWGIDYRTRPIAITTVILCVSITCNITAGLLISIGDRKTRKKDVMELLNRQELTSDAIKLVQEQREKDDESPDSKDKEKEKEKQKKPPSPERKLMKAPSSRS